MKFEKEITNTLKVGILFQLLHRHLIRDIESEYYKQAYEEMLNGNAYRINWGIKEDVHFVLALRLGKGNEDTLFSAEKDGDKLIINIWLSYLESLVLYREINKKAFIVRRIESLSSIIIWYMLSLLNEDKQNIDYNSINFEKNTKKFFNLNKVKTAFNGVISLCLLCDDKIITKNTPKQEVVDVIKQTMENDAMLSGITKYLESLNQSGYDDLVEYCEELFEKNKE